MKVWLLSRDTKLERGGHKKIKRNEGDGQARVQLYFKMSWACASGSPASDKPGKRNIGPPSSSVLLGASLSREQP